MDSRAQELLQNAERVQERIQTACKSCGRDPSGVRLVWVSKMHPLPDVEAAVSVGARDFGENRVQEALEKFSVPRPGVTLHVIGPVQSNKWRKAAQVADWIHSVESLEALRKYDEVCRESGKILQVLIQVNTSREITKSGLHMENAEAFLASLPNLEFVRYRGLMTIGVNTGVPEDSRQGFAWLSALRDRMHAQGGIYAQFTELSMGMTDDLEVAIAEGSTMIRVGTAIFGARNY
jgi:PLP dependent protein